MSYLIDVNVLLATGWLSHMHCQHVRSWQAAQSAFATCPLVQMGFVRVSMSPAFGVGFAEARDSLQASLRRGNHQFVIDDLQGSGLPTLTGYKEVTDAHLVLVAKRHGLKLATLDKPLCTKPWAQGIAEYIGP